MTVLHGTHLDAVEVTLLVLVSEVDPVPTGDRAHVGSGRLLLSGSSPRYILANALSTTAVSTSLLYVGIAAIVVAVIVIGLFPVPS